MTMNKVKTILKEKVRTNKFLLLHKDSDFGVTHLVGVAKIGRKHFRFEMSLHKARYAKRARVWILSVVLV